MNVQYASSNENAVLARAFEEHRDNKKTCFRVGDVYVKKTEYTV